MKAKTYLDKTSDWLDKICGVLIVVMLAAMVVITGAQIVCRTWFTALAWSDEVTRYLLIWSTFLGATCVYRHGGNISITFVQEALPPKAARVLREAQQNRHCPAHQDEIYIHLHSHQHGHFHRSRPEAHGG